MRSSRRCARASASAPSSTATRACTCSPRTRRCGARGRRDSRRACSPPSLPRTALSPISASTRANRAGRAGRRPASSSAASVPTRRPASCSGRWTGSGSSTGTSTPIRAGCRRWRRCSASSIPPEHELIFYRASSYPIPPGEAVRMPLRALAALASPPAPTLYVPPLPSRPVDRAMAARIGVTLS